MREKVLSGVLGKHGRMEMKTRQRGEAVNRSFALLSVRIPAPMLSLTNPIPDTPQPASLGMLALGAQSVPLWRRKKSVGAAQ